MTTFINLDLVKQTLKALKRSDYPPGDWFDSILVSSESAEPGDAIARIIKGMIVGKLGWWREQSNIPVQATSTVEKEIFHDCYANQEQIRISFKMDIQNSNRKSDLNAWSTLYHRYCVKPALSPDDLSHAAERTIRQLNTYERKGIRLLSLLLIEAENAALNNEDRQHSLKPANLAEQHAEHLAFAAESLLGLMGDHHTIEKCDDAIRFATEHNAILPLVRASVAKIYALLQGNLSQFEQAEQILIDLENDPRIQQIDHPARKAWIMALLGIYRAHITRRRGMPLVAAECASTAIKWGDTIIDLDRSLTARCYMVRGIMRWSSGRYTQAEADLKHALTLAGDKAYNTLGVMGLNYWSMCRFDLAEKYIKQAIMLAAEQKDHWQLAYERGNLGLVFASQGRLREGFFYISSHRKSAEQTGFAAEISRAVANQNIIRMHQGEYNLARVGLEASRSTFENLRRMDSLCVVYCNLSQLYTMMGHSSLALKMANLALELSRNIHGSIPPKIIAYRAMAECNLLPHEQRCMYLGQALELSQGIRPYDEGACLLALGYLSESKEERRRLWNQGKETLRKVGSSAWLKTLSLDSYPRLLLVI